MRLHISRPHLWFMVLILALLSNALVPFLAKAEEIEKPSDIQIESFVKEKLPPYLQFKTIEIKDPQQTKKELKYSAKVTVAVNEHLYKEVTNEVPEILNAPKTEIEPPTIIKKLNGAGEIIEIPVDVQFQYVRDEWKSSNVDDHGFIATLGLPQKDFKFGATVFGSADAKKAITQYLKDSQSRLKNDKEKHSNHVSSSSSELKHEEVKKEADTEKPSASTDSVQSTPIETAADSPTAASEKVTFKEFEKKFYVGEKETDTHLKSSESNIQKVLRTTKKDSDFKTFEQKYKDDLLALAENYSKAANEAIFERATTNFRVRAMCEEFALAYKNFANGDYAQARIVMERAQKKKDEVRESLSSKLN